MLAWLRLARVAALLTVGGVGQAKATRYGERFLAVIAAHTAEQERRDDQQS